MISDMEPEVVITDIKMPKMDGLSMIRQAKEMGASCDFVILSGYAEFVCTAGNPIRSNGLSAEAGICFRRERIAEQIK